MHFSIEKVKLELFVFKIDAICGLKIRLTNSYTLAKSHKYIVQKPHFHQKTLNTQKLWMESIEHISMQFKGVELQFALW